MIASESTFVRRRRNRRSDDERPWCPVGASDETAGAFRQTVGDGYFGDTFSLKNACVGEAGYVLPR